MRPIFLAGLLLQAQIFVALAALVVDQGATPDQAAAAAHAAYERRPISFDAPFAHFIAGETNAIPDSAKRGWELFNARARRNLCQALLDNQRDVTLFGSMQTPWDVLDHYNKGDGITDPWLDQDMQPQARLWRAIPPKRENARGERAFSVVDLGVVGSSTYSRGDFGGLVKSRVNSFKLLFSEPSRCLNS